jgi:nucleoside-diphosphate-sugar epimerase
MVNTKNVKKTASISKPKILITGASGYIGCELGFLLNSNIYDLTFVDFNFSPGIESQFKQKQNRVLNENFFNINISKYDLIVHLAYVTDVTRIKQDKLINHSLNNEKVNVDGVKYILENANSDCKIIYPSTHVVFEGLERENTSIPIIHENIKPIAKSIYSKQKIQNEIDITNSNKNYILFRLGSVYGLNNSINTKILVNLFSFNAAKGNALKLFSGGVNYKPTVCVKDVARAIQFMIEDHFTKGKLNQQTYNLSNRSLTIEQIARICKKYIPSLEIIDTNDPIPNLGYVLNDEKIIDTGFSYRENIESHILEMINYWKTYEA